MSSRSYIITVKISDEGGCCAMSVPCDFQSDISSEEMREIGHKATQVFAKSWIAWAEKGYPRAQNELADLEYDDGNYEEALKWYRLAAGKGYAAAQYMLGYMYLNGIAVEKDEGKGIELIQKAANRGNTQAQLVLGIAYYDGTGVEQNYEEAMKWLLKAEKKKHRYARFLVGEAYFYGNGVKRDEAKAIELWTKAARQGDPDAQTSMGIFFKSRKEYAEAVKWFQMAAEHGNADAQYHLAQTYTIMDALQFFDEFNMKLEGKTPRAKKKAPQRIRHTYEISELLRRAAEQGHADAQYRLAEMYDKADGVKRDLSIAARWYREAAEGGNPEAQYRLGFMYQYGQGIEENEYEAIRLWYLAAKQGEPHAEESLRIRNLTSEKAVKNKLLEALVRLLAFRRGSELRRQDLMSA